MLFKFALTEKPDCAIIAPAGVQHGELAEWSKAHDWKSCVG